jgi:hypothetical protein
VEVGSTLPAEAFHRLGDMTACHDRVSTSVEVNTSCPQRVSKIYTLKELRKFTWVGDSPPKVGLKDVGRRVEMYVVDHRLARVCRRQGVAGVRQYPSPKGGPTPGLGLRLVGLEPGQGFADEAQLCRHVLRGGLGQTQKLGLGTHSRILVGENVRLVM